MLILLGVIIVSFFLFIFDEVVFVWIILLFNQFVIGNNFPHFNSFSVRESILMALNQLPKRNLIQMLVNWVAMLAKFGLARTILLDLTIEVE